MIKRSNKRDKNKVVVILSISSDIGRELARKYSEDGYLVIGTYRSKRSLSELKKIKNCRLYQCDLMDKDSLLKFAKVFGKTKLYWDVFISCPCSPLPLKAFFDSDFDEWSDSVKVNAVEQLRALHLLFPFRNKKGGPSAVFFAGGGVNNSVKNFSAYTISKIMLIKMCEFLDSENYDLNVFSVGPGWTRTKVHDLIIENTNAKDEKHIKTVEFLKSERGTSMEDIYDCINWLIARGKGVAGGRNFSVVNDNWKEENGAALARELVKDTNMYKLRRFKNDWPNTK